MNDGAESAVRRLIASDPFARKLGIELICLSDGAATLRMAAGEDLANFHGTIHGGCLFALADAAHAAASNSRGERAVAMHMTIDYLRPAFVGRPLVARAQEADRGRTTALYDIRVEEEASGRLVAIAVGRVKISAGEGMS